MVESRVWCWAAGLSVGPGWLRTTSGQRPTAGEGGLSSACGGGMALTSASLHAGLAEKWPPLPSLMPAALCPLGGGTPPDSPSP